MTKPPQLCAHPIENRAWVAPQRRGKPCGKPAHVERNSRWYCRGHDPHLLEMRRLAKAPSSIARLAAIEEAASKAGIPVPLIQTRGAHRTVEIPHTTFISLCERAAKEGDLPPNPPMDRP